MPLPQTLLPHPHNALDLSNMCVCVCGAGAATARPKTYTLVSALFSAAKFVRCVCVP